MNSIELSKQHQVHAPVLEPEVHAPEPEPEKKFEQIDNTHFELKYLNDPKQNIRITMHDDEDSKKIEWENLPPNLRMAIETDYEEVKKHPLVFLNKALCEEKENEEGLRDQEELKIAVNEAIELQALNPFDFYKEIDEEDDVIGQGGFGKVFKA